MKKLLIPANITPVILGLMVSHSVLEANNSVDFYFFGSKDDARFLFAGDDVVLMCEAKGFLNPTLKLTFNGNELFDGDNLVAQNDSRLEVNVMGSCLQLMIRRLESSLNGEYRCLVTEMSIDTGESLNSSLYLVVRKSPQCLNNGSSNINNMPMVHLDCIHFLEDEVIWSFSLIRAGNETINTSPVMENSLISNYTIGTNKMSTRLSQVTNDQIKSFTCSLKSSPMDLCIIDNNQALFEGPTISPFDTTKVSSSNCSMPSSVNRSQMTPTNLLPTVTQSTFLTPSESSDNPNKMNSLLAIILPIVLFILVCLFITSLLCVYFKNRNQKEQDTRQDTVNHLFGGSVQINHHLSQYVYATASERAEETTFAYDSVPYTTNQDDDYDDDKRHVRPSTVNTEIPQSNPVYESAPSIKMPPHHLQDVALDKKVLSLDPVYKETPTKITHLKENNGNTEQVDKSKKSSYKPVDRSDQERPPSAVYATVDRKNKNKKSETNASNLEEKVEMSNTDPTRDHAFAYSNAEIEYDAITRL